MLGQPVTFVLNASTTIAAVNIGKNGTKLPSLVIVPQRTKNTTSVAVQESALIIAIDTANLKTIIYYVQVPSGAVYKLSGDKMVQSIDMMDPSTSNLAILPDTLVGSGKSKRDPSATPNYMIIPRGLKGVSPNTVKVTEVACTQMTCLDTGEKAMFNSFTQNCYCSTLEPATTIPVGVGAKVKRHGDVKVFPKLDLGFARSYMKSWPNGRQWR